jgi:hypothetical protein
MHEKMEERSLEQQATSEENKSKETQKQAFPSKSIDLNNIQKKPGKSNHYNNSKIKRGKVQEKKEHDSKPRISERNKLTATKKIQKSIVFHNYSSSCWVKRHE